jgi:hypothetical protein
VIKLKTLKEGSEVYLICGYQWIHKIIIMKEMYNFDYQKNNEPTIYTVDSKEASTNNMKRLFSYDEHNLFKTENEAKENRIIKR